MSPENAARNTAPERLRPRLVVPGKLGEKVEFAGGHPRIVRGDGLAQETSTKDTSASARFESLRKALAEEAERSAPKEVVSESRAKNFLDFDPVGQRRGIPWRAMESELEPEPEEIGIEDLVELKPHEEYVLEQQEKAQRERMENMRKPPRGPVMDERFEYQKRGGGKQPEKSVTERIQEQRAKFAAWKEKRADEIRFAEGDRIVTQIGEELDNEIAPYKYAEEIALRRVGEAQEQANACFREGARMNRVAAEMDQIFRDAEETRARAQKLDRYVETRIAEDRVFQAVENAAKARVRAARNFLSAVGLLVVGLGTNEYAASGKAKEDAARSGNQDVIELAMEEGAYAQRLTQFGQRIGEEAQAFVNETAQEFGASESGAGSAEKARYGSRKEQLTRQRYGQFAGDEEEMQPDQINDELNGLAEIRHEAGKTDEIETRRIDAADELVWDRVEDRLGGGSHALRGPARQLVRDVLQTRADDSNDALETFDQAETEDDGFRRVPNGDEGDFREFTRAEGIRERGEREGQARIDKADLQRLERAFGPGSWDNPADFPLDPNKPVAGRGPVTPLSRFGRKQ